MRFLIDDLLIAISLILPPEDMIHAARRGGSAGWLELSQDKEALTEALLGIYQTGLRYLLGRWLRQCEPVQAEEICGFKDYILALLEQAAWKEGLNARLAILWENPEMDIAEPGEGHFLWKRLLQGAEVSDESKGSLVHYFKSSVREYCWEGLAIRGADVLEDKLQVWAEDIRNLTRLWMDLQRRPREEECVHRITERLACIKNPGFYGFPLRTVLPNQEVSEGWTLFHVVAQWGSLEFLNQLLSQGGENTAMLGSLKRPESWDPLYLTQRLKWAVQAHQRDSILQSIALGADVHGISKTGKTVLHYAAEVHDPALIVLLLEQGVNVWAADEQGYSALHSAVASSGKNTDRKRGTLECLLKFDDLMALPDKEGRTPCALAVGLNDVESLRVFTERCSFHLFESDEESNTLLHMAAKAGQEGAYAFLLRQGLDPHALNKAGKAALENVPLALRGRFEACFMDWSRAQTQRRRIEAELKGLLSAAPSPENKVEREMFDLLMTVEDEGATWFKVGQLYEERGQWHPALRCYRSARDQGHREGRERATTLEKRQKTEVQRTLLLSQERVSMFERTVRGKTVLQESLEAITTSHPVHAACAQLSTKLPKLNWVTQPLGTLSALRTVLYWAPLVEQLKEGRKKSPLECQLIEEMFSPLLGKVKQRWGEESRKLILPKHDPYYEGRLYAFYKKASLGERQLFSQEKGEYSYLPFFSIVMPYLLSKMHQLRDEVQSSLQEEGILSGRWLLSPIERLLSYYHAEIEACYRGGHHFELKVPTVQPLLHSLETGRAYLSPEAAKRLLPAEGALGLKRENETGVHAVVMLNGVHYKNIDPESSFSSAAPGIEYAMDALHHLIAGQGSPPTTLLKVSCGAIFCTYQASKTVEGLGLDALLEFYPEDLKALDPTNYSAMMVLSALTLPRDGKGDNYIARLSGRDGELHALQILSIDHDRMFGLPLLRTKGGITTEAQTVLFLFPQMQNPVDPVFREAFLTLKPEWICLAWLGQLHQQNQQYETLVKEGVFTRQEYGGKAGYLEERGLQLPIHLPLGFIETLYHKLVTLQNHLRHHADATHADLLRCVEPYVARIYARLATQEGSILEKTAHIWNQDLEPSVFGDLFSEEEIAGCKVWSTHPSVLRPPISVRQAGEDLLKAIRIGSMEKRDALLTLMYIQEHVPLIRVITLEGVGKGLSFQEVTQRLSSFSYLEQLILKRACIKDVEVFEALLVSHPGVNVVLQLSEQEPLPCAWEALAAWQGRRGLYLGLGEKVWSLENSLEEIKKVWERGGKRAAERGYSRGSLSGQSLFQERHPLSEHIMLPFSP